MKYILYLIVPILVVSGCSQKESPAYRAKEFREKALQFIATKKTDSALICLDSLERLDRSSQVEVYRLRTTAYLMQKRYSEAYNSVQRLLVLQPGVPDDLTTAGTLQDILNDSVGARQTYSKALTMYADLLNHTYNQQKQLSIKVNMVYLLVLSGQKDKALQQLGQIKNDSRLGPEALERMKNLTRDELLKLFKSES